MILLGSWTRWRCPRPLSSVTAWEGMYYPRLYLEWTLTLHLSIVGAHLAAERSDRVVAAILIGPVYPNDSIAPVFEKRIQTVEKEGMEPMANTIPYAALGKKASPLAKGFIRELLLGQNPAGYCSNCRVIINAKPPNYSKIAVPVLILAGEEDKSAPLEGCQKMFDEIGTSEKRLEVMKGVGHWHCVEAFEDVGKQILSFYHEIQ